MSQSGATSDLSAAEQLLREARVTGEAVDLRAGDPEVDAPEHAAEWPDERTVRAEVLHEMLVAPAPSGSPPPRRLDLRGARIAGQLDLCDARLVCALALVDCRFDQPLLLVSAQAARIRLSGSHVPAVHAAGLRTTGVLEADDGFTCPGGFQLTSADIGGDVMCAGARLGSEDGAALIADAATVSGHVRLGPEFEARGTTNLVGARIRGQLNCTGGSFANPGGLALVADDAVVEGAAFLDDASFEGELRLQGAEIRGTLGLTGIRLDNPDGTALLAGALTVGRNLVMSEGRVTGEMRILNARVGGQFVCRGAVLRKSSTPAFAADGIRVDSDCMFSGGFEVEGGAVLSGATVGGQLVCRQGTFRDAEAPALVLDGATVGQDLILGPDLVSDGETRLIGASVGRQLRFDGTFSNPGDDALSADGVEARGGLFSGPGLRVEGQLRLHVARIPGSLLLEHGELHNPGGSCLTADGMVVAAHARFGSHLSTSGTMSLRAVEVGAQLVFDECALSAPSVAVDLERLVVKGPLLMWPRSLEGGLDLTHTTAAVYSDQLQMWPARLAIEGFLYDAIQSKPPVSTAQRLSWVASHAGGYSPQPYEQLAATLRNVGSEDEARDVLIAKQRARRRQLGWPARVWDWLLDVTVAYGYRTWRALAFLAFLLVVGGVVMDRAHPEHVVPTKPASQMPDFEPLIYAADALIPVVNLHQRDLWAAEGFAVWVVAALVVAGWMLTTIVVAALTGLLRRE